MKDFFLYKKETEKPHYVLIAGDRVWLIPFTADIEPGKGRMAIESSREEAAVNSEPTELVESGKVAFSKEDGGKIECVFYGSGGSFMNGGFVFVLPSWGRHTQRRLWVVIKSKSNGETPGEETDDKTHSDVETQRQ
ncbi:MAG: hypothetical protein OXF42_02535 [Candidatus Dadabacteria bacterium]|nr:hypothetical protein [Candidatus Dadabacteria bacterium]